MMGIRAPRPTPVNATAWVIGVCGVARRRSDRSRHQRWPTAHLLGIPFDRDRDQRSPRRGPRAPRLSAPVPDSELVGPIQNRDFTLSSIRNVLETPICFFGKAVGPKGQRAADRLQGSFIAYDVGSRHAASSGQLRANRLSPLVRCLMPLAIHTSAQDGADVAT